MKKILLLSAGLLAILSANAQLRNSNAIYRGSANQKAVMMSTPARIGAHHAASKTTSVVIATETFGTGTDTTLPTGWTAGIMNGPGSWHWTKDSSTSPNSLGFMHSTTATNGWMIFDADSIQNDCTCSPSAWLQSPAYNCSTHPTVRLNFEEYYGNVFDTCEVWVSPDPTFATYTRYPVTLNNNLDFGNTTANITTIHINISAAAAGLPVVYIRYVYYGDDFFDLSWMVDDMSLTELDPYDAGVSGSFMLAPDATAFNSSVFNTPLVFVDSFIPGSRLSNYGSNSETAVTTATIYQGTTSVYSQSNTYTGLPVNAVDSVIWFPGYQPAAIGSYICALNTVVTGDADSTNNLDTVRFNITDTTWMQNDTNVTINYVVYAPPGSFGPTAFASMLGTRFDVPSSSVGDTVSGFGVAISPATPPTTPGVKVSVQLYSRQKGDTGWHYQGTSVARGITAGDTSSFLAVKWADFRIDTAASGGVTPFILQAGASYAAVLQTDHITTPLLIFGSTTTKIPGFNGAFELNDTSRNDGGAGFHQFPADTTFSKFIPFIRMYFGTVPVDHTGVRDVTFSSMAGAAYPDPANSLVHIPFIIDQDARVKATLTNMAGQVIKTQFLSAVSGRPMTATFAISDLAEGDYIYTLDTNGRQTSGHISVMH